MLEPPRPTSGLFAGRYIIERLLGEGASAKVYLARDTVGGTSVALKMLHPELAETSAARRFLDEIRKTQALQHPRILPVMNSGVVDGQPWFALPYMEGGTLRDRLQRDKQLGVEEALTIARSVADALDYAHERKLIHRDVKPENILFTAGVACLGDFGIARALINVYGGTWSSAGIIRGTAAYMSPEQASADPDCDGRSDVYSLSCVFYEMLAGMPAFVGPTPEIVMSLHSRMTPRELRVFRPSVTAELEAVIIKGLAIRPADRFRTAGEFVSALNAAYRAPSLTVRPSDNGDYSSKMRSRRTAFLAGAFFATAVVVAVILALLRPRPRGLEALDTTRIAVLPLERVGPAPANAPWQDDDLLHQALGRWRGISIVDQFQVADALRRNGPITTSDDAASVATALGAGRYIRGRIAPFGNGWRVSATLFDVARRDALHESTASISLDLNVAMKAYAALADSLLFRGSVPDAGRALASGRRSLPAVQAFARGQRALEDWDLSGADSAFQAAFDMDAYYAPAALWLSQVRAWQDRSPTTWGTLAERARSMSNQLPERETHLARALVDLSTARYGEACNEYTRLANLNDRDFTAWFGLGQCRMMNNRVVADSQSPSGWRFESSAHRAMEAYAKAFEILPSVHRGYERSAFQRLRVLLLQSASIRIGYGPDSAIFYARPGWMGDTLVLVPYPRAVVIQGGAPAIPPGFSTAVARRREAFRRVAARWSGAFPQSSAAKEAVALSLEQLGDSTAIDTLRAARALAGDQMRERELAVEQFLLLVKFGIPDGAPSRRAAASLADSLLSTNATLSADVARALVPVAVLRGRCRQAIDLVRIGGLEPNGYQLSPQLYVLAQQVLIGNALQCSPRDQTLEQLASAITREARDSSARALLDGLLLFRPALLQAGADPRVLRRVLASTNHRLIQAALFAATGDASRARDALQSWSSAAVLGRTPDFAYGAALVWLAVGDSIAAASVLDETLGKLRDGEPELLSEPGRSAALLASIRLRAELAKAQPDGAAAARWSAVAQDLTGDSRPH